jgi:hypothetical protein
MKWQRGLFRLWIVLSACWIVAVGSFTWSTLPRDEEVVPPGYVVDFDKPLPTLPHWDPLDPKPPFDPNQPYTIIRSAERIEQIKRAVVVAFAAPSIVLILGTALAWVVRGFRSAGA